jgi:hypothetical protein
MEVPHPLRLLSLPLEDRERPPTLAAGASSEIENSVMDEASISTLRSELDLD